MLLPLQGAPNRFIPTQGDALGYVLVAPAGRAVNACRPMAADILRTPAWDMRARCPFGARLERL